MDSSALCLQGEDSPLFNKGLSSRKQRADLMLNSLLLGYFMKLVPEAAVERDRALKQFQAFLSQNNIADNMIKLEIER